jgi:hypothetical protein
VEVSLAGTVGDAEISVTDAARDELAERVTRAGYVAVL